MGIIKKLKKYSWMLPIFKSASKEDRKNFIEGYKNRKKFYTPPDTTITANIKDMAKCALCPNMCRFDCPAVQVTKKETYAPAQKARISYFMAMGRIPMDDPSAIETLYACMKCDACLEWCPMDISTGDFLGEMRIELEKKDLIPKKLHHLKDNITKNGSVFGESPFKANSGFNISKKKAEIFFYVGCMDIKYRPQTVRATIAILNHLGIEFTTEFENRECCGGPIKKTGYNTVARELSERNQETINNSKAKIVLCNCPGCFSTLKQTYSDFGNKISPDVMHSITYFLQKIKDGCLKPKNSIDKRITYHDPCLLSRKSSVHNCIDEARDIFKAIPGLVLEEAYLHGNETRCCGMGGAYAPSNPENSSKLGKDRLKQLEKHNPDYIVSGCPTCEYAFQEAETQMGYKEDKVKNLVELLADSLGLKY